jgi:hypothetical protein
MAILIVGLGIIVVFSALYALEEKRRNRAHVFELSSTPRFLTETLALEMSKKALILEGIDANTAVPQKDMRSLDPDGNRDDYLARNGENPNRGAIMFVYGGRPDVCSVSVELDGNQVTCRVSKPK